MAQQLTGGAKTRVHAVLGVALVVAIVFGYLAFELLNRTTITVKIEDKYGFQPCGGPGNQKPKVDREHYTPCSVVFTDQGTFRFPKIRRSRYGFTYVDGLWSDPPQMLWDELKIGCHYVVVMTGGGNRLARQSLGDDRLPPLNKIVRVLNRVEASEAACATVANAATNP